MENTKTTVEKKVTYTNIFKRSFKNEQYVYVEKSNWDIKKYWPYSDVLNVEISSNWKSFVFIGIKESWKYTINKDWKELWDYEYIWVHVTEERPSYKYSPNWESFTYAVVKEKWKYIIIQDWKELWEFTKNFYFDYSEDSRRLLINIGV